MNEKDFVLYFEKKKRALEKAGFIITKFSIDYINEKPVPTWELTIGNEHPLSKILMMVFGNHGKKKKN